MALICNVHIYSLEEELIHKQNGSSTHHPGIGQLNRYRIN